MDQLPRDSERTKAAILDAAARLFSERNFKRVTMRDIAAEAGINHALVHRYFGTKEDLVQEILRRQVDDIRTRFPQGLTVDSLDYVRRVLCRTMVDREHVLQLLVRSELSGFEPAKLFGEDVRPLESIVEWIREQRSQLPESELTAHDPALITAVALAAMSAFASLSPWIMAMVGLSPEDYEDDRDEIIDILLDMIALAAGVPRGDDRAVTQAD